MSLVEFFPGQEYPGRWLDAGDHAVIYAISDKHVAKVPTWNQRYAISSVECEYRHILELFNHGVSVPEPEGVFKVEVAALRTLLGFQPPVKVAFVMQ
jgi:hypothetical protein